MDPQFDDAMMARALVLAQSARCWASPNPHVGCVLVRDGSIIGEGFTQPAGADHAEIVALKMAGDALGATAYVTLEPCAHTGLTGPCADALINARVKRVVIAILDPNPAVSGRGVERLSSAGIQVDVGVREAEAAVELTGFLLRMRRGWGRVRLKLASSLDGRTAMASGESQWITSAAARQDVQVLRAQSSMIITGIGTVLADNCALTVRAEQLALQGAALMRASYRQPLRVVIDSHCRTPLDAKVCAEDTQTLVAVADSLDSPGAKALMAQSKPHLEVISLPGPADDSGNQQVDLSALMAALGARGGNEILVEAGPTLAAALLRAELVDELVCYQAPKLLGASAQPLVTMDIGRLAEAVQLSFVDISRIGDDLRITAVPIY